MKLAVFSDIHSNYHGFHACYEEAVKRGVNQFLFLGDYVSDCAYPEKTMGLITISETGIPVLLYEGTGRIIY